MKKKDDIEKEERLFHRFITKKMREYQLDNDLTDDDMADLLHISTLRYQQYVEDERELLAVTVADFCDHADIDMIELFNEFNDRAAH